MSKDTLPPPAQPLTLTQWLICFIAAIGFAFDIYELLMLPLMFGIGAGSMATGRVVSRTGRTAIYPSLGLIVVTAALVALALRAGDLGVRQLSLFLFFTGLFMGTVMGVVQVTVQSAAGVASLGSAAASVQLSRALGAAFGTALVGTVLFAVLTWQDPDAARRVVHA